MSIDGLRSNKTKLKEEVPLNIQEAIKSKKRFKRTRWSCFYYATERNGTFCFAQDVSGSCRFPTIEDLCAEDYELESQAIMITKSQFLEAFAEGMKEYLMETAVYPFDSLIKDKMDSLKYVIKRLFKS